MWIRRPAVLHAATGFFAAGLVFAAAIPARAETTDLQACATQYQAAKADNKLNGQAWQDFFTDLQGQDKRQQYVIGQQRHMAPYRYRFPPRARVFWRGNAAQPAIL